MIDLFIDTCISYVRIALFENKKLVDFYEENFDIDMSKFFICKVNEILRKHDVEFKNIDKIFVANGPGSFTGIRVGLTFVKVLGWSLNKKIIPLSELQVLASSSFNTKYIMPLIDARRGYVYAGVYDFNLNNIFPDSYIKLEDLLIKYSAKDVTFVSYDTFNFDVFVPKINYNKLYEKNYNNKFVDAYVLLPNYLKNTEAEDKLNYDSTI